MTVYVELYHHSEHVHAFSLLPRRNAYCSSASLMIVEMLFRVRRVTSSNSAFSSSLSRSDTTLYRGFSFMLPMIISMPEGVYLVTVCRSSAAPGPSRPDWPPR